MSSETNTSSTERIAKSRKPFVLVVDDEKRIADTLALILASKDYESQATYDGLSALELCRRKTPDLLITDVVMPGMSGVELGINIRREFGQCKVLLFSGQAATAQLMEDASVHGYQFELLAKPVHPALLLERVAQLLQNATATPSNPTTSNFKQ